MFDFMRDLKSHLILNKKAIFASLIPNSISVQKPNFCAQKSVNNKHLPHNVNQKSATLNSHNKQFTEKRASSFCNPPFTHNVHTYTRHQ